ncbi:MAG: hypothetical protein ACI8RD_003546 [Bacillariaceae sp.]|jgi:hypothetical protein
MVLVYFCSLLFIRMEDPLSIVLCCECQYGRGAMVTDVSYDTRYPLPCALLTQLDFVCLWMTLFNAVRKIQKDDRAPIF